MKVHTLTDEIETILKNTKVSMETERFTISRELEEAGRKILSGEITNDLPRSRDCGKLNPTRLNQKIRRPKKSDFQPHSKHAIR
ncbi:MAG: hypothetical protein LBV40_06045 [Methanomicrobiales archaeon]|jgi:hypothetical protein|nr:hypothetical protein [Methanomicrobiales archaeon]